MSATSTPEPIAKAKPEDSRPPGHRPWRRSGPRPWSDLIKLLRDRRGGVALLAATSVLSGFAESGILAVLAELAAALVAGKGNVPVRVGPVHATASISAMFALAFALAVLRLLLQLVMTYLPASIAADIQARLRLRLFESFTRASWAAQSRDREGYLQELITGQAESATSSITQATGLIVAAVTFVVLVISAIVLSPLAAAIVLVTAVALFAVMRPLNALGRRRGEALSLRAIDLASGAGESVRLAEEVKVFGVDEAQERRMGKLAIDMRRPYFHTQLLARLVPGVYQSLVYVLVIAGLLVLYLLGSTHASSLGAVVLLLVRAGAYGQQVQGNFQYLSQTLPSLENIRTAERRYASRPALGGSRPLKHVSSLAAEGVSYAYEQARPVLTDVSFGVKRGEAIGIVGPSGAGKSTLVQILLGLRFPDSGAYLVNGESVAEFSRSDWHRLVAYVSQEPRLLHASVTENIRFFRDLDDAAIRRAAELAGIHETIMAWPEGYATLVGPRADAVSGGQQQRVCLARALAARPEVLVLDEPTSALDPQSEAKIQESLAALKGQLTLFVVAHRMSTLSVCDKVMVIVDGRLQAFDTVSALDSNDYYRVASALAAGGRFDET